MTHVSVLAGVNLCPNPSFETSVPTAGATGGIVGTTTRDPTKAWVGTSSYHHNVTSTTLNSAWRGSDVVIPVTPGQRYSVAVRIQRAGTINSYVLGLWRASGGAGIGAAFDISPLTAGATTDWDLAYVNTLVAPAGAVDLRLTLRVQAPTAGQTGDVWYDGVHVGPNDDAANYVDGDQGSGYSWDGTPHASTSKRAATTVAHQLGRSGWIIMRPELWLARKDNRLVQDVSALVTDGFVEMDYTRDIKTVATFDVIDPDAFDPYVDYLAPFLELEYPDGNSERSQLGLYAFEPFEESWDSVSHTARIDGRDLTYLVQQVTRATTYEIAGGANIVAACKSLLAANGISRVNIPASTRVAPSRGWRRPPGTTILKIASDLMNSIGYYTLFAGRTGVVSSRPFVDRSTETPVKKYTTVDDTTSVLVPYKHRLIEKPYNHVILIRELGDQTLKAEIKNTNPANPTSIPNIGQKTYFARDDKAVDQASLNEAAREILEEFGLLEVEADFLTLPEPWHGIHELYELALTDRTGAPIPKATGLFWCTGWRLALSPRGGGMTHKIKRAVKYSEAA
jgi:hypothetical protein